jgi:hypothetical protein
VLTHKIPLFRTVGKGDGPVDNVEFVDLVVLAVLESLYQLNFVGYATLDSSAPKPIHYEEGLLLLPACVVKANRYRENVTLG